MVSIVNVYCSSFDKFGRNLWRKHGICRWKKKKYNDLEQFIKQFLGTGQASVCDANGDTTTSRNNLALHQYIQAYPLRV
ncbi:MAG: hypothetical protein L0H53_13550 [Candidatus Nitrosocosmicus sp.]|nr:hypothetical protein [Candidatus Nitrosocosmicus sp.]MDN5867059.1 hypothetical protein [Candidatus Nitrosocosmicus sp.]